MKYSHITPHTRDKAPKVLPKSETPTLPKMKSTMLEDTRTQIEGLSKLPGNREISSKICSADGLKDPLLLKCRRPSHCEGALVFAEYFLDDGTDDGPTYVYVAEGYTQSDSKFASLNNPDATAIWRIDKEGATPTEIHRWEEKKSEE